jgi:ubiquitin-activating enzyme E1
VYGWKFIDKIGSLKYFMVGCGALGCEFMKNFALNGICCGSHFYFSSSII